MTIQHESHPNGTNDHNPLAGERGSKQFGHWTFAEYSIICLYEDGIGCDDCACPCHGPYAPEFLTYKDVAEWHTDDNGYES